MNVDVTIAGSIRTNMELNFSPVVMSAGVVYLIKINLLIGPHSWSGKQFCSLSS